MTRPHPLPDRHALEQLARDGVLTGEGLDIALRRLGYLPDAAAWRRFGNLALLAAGSLLLLAGIVFFFAFNWDVLHRFAKIGLIAAPLIAATALAAHFAGQHRFRASLAWLGAAVVLTGVLLAVMGQIYQTGADSELLFAGWAALTLPWVLAGRAPWLWLFWLLLVNVALGLFISGRFGIWMLLGGLSDGLLWLPLLLNAAALCVWEMRWPRLGWMRASYAPRIIGLLAALCATTLGVTWCLQEYGRIEWRVMRYTPLIYFAWLGATLWFYRCRRHDIVPLAVAALSFIIVVTSELVHWLFDLRGEWAFHLLLTGLAVAAMTAAAAVWLRRTAQAWEAEAINTTWARDA
ncbi:MAG: DUF2157 domain-containing protein [Zoogloeaceae bacterium]|jgi:uncharacterized membrane protein|nr:DUF2157 domain-containing protein [Zoogloeaceae bacterium]